MLDTYQHAGKPLNIPIIRDILHMLVPWQEPLPVLVFFDIITEHHLRKGGERAVLEDTHAATYGILCEMEAEGRAERYRDAGKDYWKLLPENSGDDETEVITLSSIDDMARNTFASFGLEILKRAVLLVLHGETDIVSEKSLYPNGRLLKAEQIRKRLKILRPRLVAASTNSLIHGILDHLQHDGHAYHYVSVGWGITQKGVSVLEDSQ